MRFGQQSIFIWLGFLKGEMKHTDCPGLIIIGLLKKNYFKKINFGSLL